MTCSTEQRTLPWSDAGLRCHVDEFEKKIFGFPERPKKWPSYAVTFAAADECISLSYCGGRVTNPVTLDNNPKPLFVL
jgi:hypothetical protein